MDPAIIAALSSTKNRADERDPDMRQVKKENHYYFGMKLHNCLDSRTGLVQNFNATSTNVHEVTEAHRSLHGGERRAWEDAGYTGVQKRE